MRLSRQPRMYKYTVRTDGGGGAGGEDEGEGEGEDGGEDEGEDVQCCSALGVNQQSSRHCST